MRVGLHLLSFNSTTDIRPLFRMLPSLFYRFMRAFLGLFSGVTISEGTLFEVLYCLLSAIAVKLNSALKAVIFGPSQPEFNWLTEMGAHPYLSLLPVNL